MCGEYGIYGDSHEIYDYCESDYFDDSGSGKSFNLGEVTDSES